MPRRAVPRTAPTGSHVSGPRAVLGAACPLPYGACGAIALGHPLGGSGARLMTTMLGHMRAEGIRYGLQTMCEGGGQANATILELLDS